MAIARRDLDEMPFDPLPGLAPLAARAASRLAPEPGHVRAVA